MEFGDTAQRGRAGRAATKAEGARPRAQRRSSTERLPNKSKAILRAHVAAPEDGRPPQNPRGLQRFRAILIDWQSALLGLRLRRAVFIRGSKFPRFQKCQKTGATV